MSTDTQRRRLLQSTLLAAGGLATATSGRVFAAAGAAAGGAPRPGTPIPWKMLYDLNVRIPDGGIEEWEKVWGDDQVPTLESKGQWLWASWVSLTGQQNIVTHQWAYRDMTHFQAMNEMRGSDPDIRKMTQRMGVPIQETMATAVIAPLPYHPASVPQVSEKEAGVLATNRIYYQFYGGGGGAPAAGAGGSGATAGAGAAAPPAGGGPGGGGAAAQYISASTEYVAVATRHGAQLVGAFQTYFGWTPAYMLQVWRYPSVERYWAIRKAIEADADGRRLLAKLRSIFPHETVDLNRPLSYSRIK